MKLLSEQRGGVFGTTHLSFQLEGRALSSRRRAPPIGGPANIGPLTAHAPFLQRVSAIAPVFPPIYTGSNTPILVIYYNIFFKVGYSEENKCFPAILILKPTSDSDNSYR